MSKGILTVTVNPAVDVTVTLPPVGQLRMRCSTNSSGLVLSAGGKGVNVARALRTLGVRALAAGFAGGGTGDLLQKLLRKEKIPAAFVRTGEPTRLNVTVLGPRFGRCSRVVQEGPRLTSQEIRRFEIQYRRWLRRSRLVVLAGRNAVGAPAEWYARLVCLAQREGVPAAVDTSGAALCAALKAKPFLIKPNLQEAEAIVRRRLGSRMRIKKAVQSFHQRGIRVVLLSLGARGAVVSDGQNIWYARPPSVAPGEPRLASTRPSAEAGLAAGGPAHARALHNDVGCGDALLAGFLSAFEKESLAEALRRGVACGTANALDSTPGVIRPGDVSRLMKKVTVIHWGTLGQ